MSECGDDKYTVFNDQITTILVKTYTSLRLTSVFYQYMCIYYLFRGTLKTRLCGIQITIYLCIQCLLIDYGRIRLPLVRMCNLIGYGMLVTYIASMIVSARI